MSRHFVQLPQTIALHWLFAYSGSSERRHLQLKTRALCSGQGGPLLADAAAMVARVCRSRWPNPRGYSCSVPRHENCGGGAALRKPLRGGSPCLTHRRRLGLIKTTCVCPSHGYYYRALQVGVLPGIMFYSPDPNDSDGSKDRPLLRFAICKRRKTIEEVVRRIRAMEFPPRQ